MNLKLRLVLLFSKFNKPLDTENISIAHMRKRVAKAARLGTYLFDNKIDIESEEDTSANGVPVRIYKNSKAENQTVMVYFHGGGFVLYNLDSHDNVCRRLCKINNCMVVSVDYRLAPEFTFPVAHNDALNATKWVKENIEKFGGNADSIILAGDSAGANLATCVAIKCRDFEIPIKAQILIYPWIDGKLNNPSVKRNGEGYLLTEEIMFWFQKQYTPNVEDRCHPDVSPKYQKDLSNIAPALILTAQFDPLLDDGKNYANQLKEFGNEVEYKEYPTLIHGFINMPKVSKYAMRAFEDIQDFLQDL